jgi:N-acyl-D-amino-acid deacylase
LDNKGNALILVEPFGDRAMRLVTVIFFLFFASIAQAQQPYDVLIVNGKVFDGSGNPWHYSDVGIRDGRVVALGKLAGQPAKRVVDAQGLMVSPGFIDIHSHADDTGSPQGTLRDDNARARSAPNLVTQGITTVVVNQDGRSQWPISNQKKLYEQKRIGPNAILMVGHGEVRRQVLGNDFRRPARPDEVAKMKALVRQGLQDGASGLSAGLEYVPGRWSTMEEVVALAQELVPFNGVYISHERSEGSDPMWYWPSQDPAGPPNLLDAVRETIEIGERTGATVVASHIKAKGAHYWGSSAAAIQLIERARARGVQVYADQYPYDTSGSDGSTVLIPDWAFNDGSAPAGRRDYTTALKATLADPERAAKMRGDIKHEIQRRGSAQKVVVFDHPKKEYVGKTLAEIATMMRKDPVEAAIALQLEGYPDRRGGARVRGFSLAELDIEAYAAQPWVATTTDGGIALPEDGPATHARFYGTFPRKIRKYALDRGVISLEDAIRSSTSLPARIMGLEDRGTLRVGAAADIVVFDVNRIRDKATFFEPHQYAEGIDFVLINGEFVVDQGKPTGARPGKVLTTGPVRPRPST